MAGGWTVGLYGGEGKAAQKTLETLQERFPGIKEWARTPPKLSIANFDRHMRGKVSNSKVSCLPQDDIELMILASKVSKFGCPGVKMGICLSEKSPIRAVQ